MENELRELIKYIQDLGKNEMTDNKSQDLRVVYAQINNIEFMLEEQLDKFDLLIDRQNKLLYAAQKLLTYLFGDQINKLG